MNRKGILNPFVVGTPRSGFSLLIAIIQRIYDFNKRSFHKSNKEAVIIKLMPFFSYIFNRSCLNVFDEKGVSESVLFNGEFQLLVGGPKWVDQQGSLNVRKYFGVKGQGDFLLITKHPQILFHHHGVLHTHDNPELVCKNSHFSNTLKYSTVRHPLGIFNSAVHSINALTSEYLQRYKSGENEDLVREQIALSKLTDMKVCEGLFSHQIKFWNEYLKCREAFLELKWEDIIGDPLKVVRCISESLDISVDERDLETIWRPLDHKNLLFYHKHNYRKGHGVLGGWGNTLDFRHLKLAQKMGLDDIANALGYDFNCVELVESEFKDKLSWYLDNDLVYEITDRDLATFSFNKSNIDSSAFGFFSYDVGGSVSIERSTLVDHQLAKEVMVAAQKVNDQINEIATSIHFLGDSLSVKEILEEVVGSCEKMSCDSVSHSLLLQGMRDKEDVVKILQESIADLPNGSIVWGVGSDFLDAFLNAEPVKNFILVDAGLAGKSMYGHPIFLLSEVLHSATFILLTPSSVQTRVKMKSIIESLNWNGVVIDPYI